MSAYWWPALNKYTSAMYIQTKRFIGLGKVSSPAAQYDIPVKYIRNIRKVVVFVSQLNLNICLVLVQDSRLHNIRIIGTEPDGVKFTVWGPASN